MLNALPDSASRLLTVVETLTRLVVAAEPDDRVRVAAILVIANERLIAHVDQLSPEQRLRFERCQMMALINAGQSTKAVELAKRLSEQFPKDVEKQRELAEQLEPLSDPDALALVKQCWRRVEALSKPGSQEWLAARLAVLRTCLRLEQFDEARKLLQVTEVLYPDLGGESLRPQFESVQTKLLNKTRER